MVERPISQVRDNVRDPKRNFEGPYWSTSPRVSILQNKVA